MYEESGGDGTDEEFGCAAEVGWCCPECSLETRKVGVSRGDRPLPCIHASVMEQLTLAMYCAHSLCRVAEGSAEWRELVSSCLWA